MPSVEDLWATRRLDASRIPLSMRNDSALASRWFGPFAKASSVENPMVETAGKRPLAMIDRFGEQCGLQFHFGDVDRQAATSGFFSGELIE
jgi:hypothetical protein